MGESVEQTAVREIKEVGELDCLLLLLDGIDRLGKKRGERMYD